MTPSQAGEATEPRHDQATAEAEAEIDVSRPRSWGRLTFQSLFLLGAIAMVTLEWPRIGQFIGSFDVNAIRWDTALRWLGLMVATPLIAHDWFLTLFTRRVITLGDAALATRSRWLWSERQTSYDYARMRAVRVDYGAFNPWLVWLRAAAFGFIWRNRFNAIEFNYHDSTVRLGVGLDDADSSWLAGKIRARAPAGSMASMASMASMGEATPGRADDPTGLSATTDRANAPERRPW